MQLISCIIKFILMKDIIQKEHFYNHPIERVWKAISDAAEISSWFLKADFRAEEGYNYKFTHEDTVISGEVNRANPVHHLEYTWVVGKTNVETLVKWVLEEKDGGTLLKLEHSGISNYDGETAVKMFESFRDGWQMCVDNLEKFLKKNVKA